MNRMETPAFRNLDLLYPARLLWRGILPSCGLKCLEEEELGIARDNDIPGFLIPYSYFNFLRTGNYSTIEPVIIHHGQDILSLAYLAERITAVLKDPAKPWRVNRSALGKVFLSRGLPPGRDILNERALEGDPEAARVLGSHYKRTGHWSEAILLWESLWERGLFIYSGVELAKYYEHRVKENSKALNLTDQLLDKLRTMPPSPYRKSMVRELEIRQQRLKNKIG